MSEPERQGTTLRETVRKRSDIIESVSRDPATKPELVDRLDVSRSTVDRAVESLLEQGFVRRDESRYRLTTYGRLAVEQYREYVAATDSFAAARPLIEQIPAETGIDRSVFEDGTVSIAEPHAPENAIAPAIEYLRTAERLLVFSPVVKSSYITLVHDEVTGRGLELELVLGEGASDSLASLAEVTDAVEGLVAAEPASLYRTGTSLPFTLFLMLDGASDTVGVTVHDAGAIVGTVTAQSDDAVEWGRETFADAHADATPIGAEDLL